MANANKTNFLSALLRKLGLGRGVQTLADMQALDPDTVGRSAILGLHASIGASDGGTDVDFRTNPDFDVAVHSVRAHVEVGTAEATANSGLASFAGSHAAVKVFDPDGALNITDGTGACAGGGGFVDLGMLGANDGRGVELPIPFVFKGVKGARTLRATFASDASFPGTRRVGVAMVLSFRRKNFRQTEAV